MNENRLRSIGLATLVMWLGLQVLHIYLPAVIDFLTTYFVAEQQALYALVTFAFALFVPLIRRWLGERGALILTVAGLTLLRLVMQFTGSQMAHLILSTLGVVLWIWFIPIWHQSRRNRPTEGDLAALVVAFPLAFFLDTASRTMLWFDEIAWQNGLWPILLTAALATLTLWLLWKELRNSALAGDRAQEPGLRHLLPFLGVGPALYLAMIVLTNPVKLAVHLPGLDVRIVYFIICGLTALGVVAAMLAPRWFRVRSWLAALLFGGLLTVAMVLLNNAAGPGWLWFIFATLSMWTLFGWLLQATARKNPLETGLWRSGLVTFLALLLMLIIFFLVEEFSIIEMNIVAGGLLMLAALGTTSLAAYPRVRLPVSARRTVATIMLLGLAAVGFWTWSNQPIQVDGVPFTPVFVNGEDGYTCYRIPSIVQAGDGSLVAFAEGRVANCGDGNGIIRIVSKRSTDDGRTWGPLTVVGQNVLADGSEHVAQSPAPVVDLLDPANPQGKIVLLFNKIELTEGARPRRTGVRRVYATESLDHGQSWSIPVDITNQVHKPNRPDYTRVYPDAAIRYNNPEDWRGQVSTVGHAIQLEGMGSQDSSDTTRGRLLHIGYANMGAGGGQNYAFWSDDHGATWEIGEVNLRVGLNEAMAVELEDGGIMVNSRNYDEDGVRVGYRAVTYAAFDDEGALSFDESYTDNNLTSPTIQASLERLSYRSDADSGAKNRVLFAIADHPRLRINMTVRVSYDEGETWAVQKVIDPGPSAYNDLVAQEDGHIGLLYERGNDGGIGFLSFSLDWLTGGQDLGG